MYVEMEDGKGKPISYKLLPLHIVPPVEPNPMLGNKINLMAIL